MDELVFNGIRIDTGAPAIAPMSIAELYDRLARAYQGEVVAPPDAAVRAGLGEGIDADSLDHTGWAIVHHVDDAASAAALAALMPQRGAHARRLDYRTGEDPIAWLYRHGGIPGAPTAERVPYYLLCVGAPARIPYAFVQALASEHAVGYLGFATAGEYAAYATSVAEHETAPQIDNRREIAFWGPSHDRATQLSHAHLLQPLFRTACKREVACAGRLGHGATKANLRALLERAPSVVFTASHGVEVDAADPRRATAHGALVAADWTAGPVTASHYVAVDDTAGLRLAGTLVFSFACFSAGDPGDDAHAVVLGAPAATAPMAGPLAHAMLRRGALGVVGHLGRAYAFTFVSPDRVPDAALFARVLDRILAGRRLGHAVRDFTDACDALGRVVAPLCRRLAQGFVVDASLLARAWLPYQDAMGYIVVGDPAVRIHPRSRAP